MAYLINIRKSCGYEKAQENGTYKKCNKTAVKELISDGGGSLGVYCAKHGKELLELHGSE